MPFRTITIKNNDTTTKIVKIVHHLVVFFLIGRYKRVTLTPSFACDVSDAFIIVILTPSFARDVSDAFIMVIMTAINCCFAKYDHLLHAYQIKRARIQKALQLW